METKEIWIDVQFYEGFYQVSNHGRVKGLKRILHSRSRNGNEYTKEAKEKILKDRVDTKGYFYVSLSDARKHPPKNYRIHRLLANAFIQNPNNYNEINHKNGVRTDNRMENLEWCTRSENILHSRRVLGSRGGKCVGENNHSSRKIICENNGESYISINEAASILNLHPSGVAAVCRKERNHTGGYVFKYL